MASARRVVRQRFANRRAPPPPAPGFTLSSAHLTILASALVICVSLFNTVRGISRLEANVDALITTVGDLRSSYATTTNTIGEIQKHLSVNDTKQDATEKEVQDLKDRISALLQARLDIPSNPAPRPSR